MSAEKIESLKILKREIEDWKREELREKSGKKIEPKEEKQEDILESILSKLNK